MYPCNPSVCRVNPVIFDRRLRLLTAHGAVTVALNAMPMLLSLAHALRATA